MKPIQLMKSLWVKFNGILTTVARHATDPFLLVIRLYWGWQFFQTGKGKLGNLEGTAAFFGELGLPVPKLQALLVGGTECVGGLLLLVGLGSRVISLPLMFTMVVAYATAHREGLNGIFSDPDTFVTQAPFLFLLASAIIFVFGPGRLSIDHLIARRATNQSR